MAALASLASSDEILHVHQVLDEVRESMQDEGECVQDGIHNQFLESWEEGVEAYKGKTLKELWDMFGVGKEQRVPMLNSFIDPDGIHDPWRHEDWFNSTDSAKDKFEPRWHQLVGILRLVENAFESRNSLNVDEVGVGKTLQVIAAIALIISLRHHYEHHHDYPGMFSECMPTAEAASSPLTLLSQRGRHSPAALSRMHRLSSSSPAPCSPSGPRRSDAF